jgi:penicillin-binding protein 2
LFSRRLNIMLCALLLGGVVLLTRLAQIQIRWHDRFNEEDYKRAGGSHLVDTVRGGIYARWGTPLAVQVPSFDLGVHYEALGSNDWHDVVSSLCGVAVKDVAAKARETVERIERMEAAVNERRRQRGLAEVDVAERRQYHAVVRDVPADVAAVIRAERDRLPTVKVRRHGVPAIRVLERSRRRYPNGHIAPHVVGRVSLITREMWDRLVGDSVTWALGQPFSQVGSRYKMDDRIGVLGAEQAQEDLLRGKRGYVLNHLEFGLLTYDVVSEKTPPEPGWDVYLTIREDFQAAANEALRRAAEDAQYAGLGFHSGALVIVDARDGAVLAAVTYPSYDLATFGDDYEQLAADPRSPLLFRPLQGALPTGSVYKIMTTIAALEEGAIVPATSFTCPGYQAFGRRTFHCHAQWGHGSMTLLPAIERSCNVYFYNVGVKAGGEALARWGREFGLGVPSGIDLPYERAGTLPEPKHTYGVVNLSIGQGEILCTPLQVANAMAAMANGGKLYRPHFFDHARDADGEVVRQYEPEFRQIRVSPATLRTVREGMRRVVAEERGTARRSTIEAAVGLDLGRFRAAGKTGTAELGKGQPNHAWFAGFAPYDNPRIAFAVVNERVPGGHGGSHAAPIMAMALEPVWDAVEAMR